MYDHILNIPKIMFRSAWSSFEEKKDKKISNNFQNLRSLSGCEKSYN